MKKDFIAVSDYSPEELQGDIGPFCRPEERTPGRWERAPILKGKVLAMVFPKAQSPNPGKL
jgi:hypothetical protein